MWMEVSVIAVEVVIEVSVMWMEMNVIGVEVSVMGMEVSVRGWFGGECNGDGDESI